MSRLGRSTYCGDKENVMVYPAKVTELKRLSPHATTDVKRVRSVAPLTLR